VDEREAAGPGDGYRAHGHLWLAHGLRLAALSGAPIDEARIDTAIAVLKDDLDPPDDVQASGAVRQHLAGVLLKRVMRGLMEEA